LCFRLRRRFVIFPREMLPKRSPIDWLLIIVALCAVTATSCAPASQQRAKRGTQSNPYDFEKEGQIPPAPANVKEEADVEEMPVTADTIEVEDAEAPPDTAARPSTPPAATPTKTVGGFRVQVFASQSQDVAEAARRTAQARLGIPAYIELADSLYKVRVGDCRTREEAEVVLKTCRSVFYKDAWIVETQVKAPAPGQ
jgi:cell division septation protein DedD